VGESSGETLAATYAALLALVAAIAIRVLSSDDSGLLAAQSMLKLIAAFVFAFLGRLLGHASGYEIGFRGGRPLLERLGRTLKLRLRPSTGVRSYLNGLHGAER
jgi:hypothetical protein